MTPKDIRNRAVERGPHGYALRDRPRRCSLVGFVPHHGDASRLAVTAQSTRKRISPKLMNQLATALIVRAVSGGGNPVDRVRRYMRLREAAA